jgi:2,4-dienoyl-CoA reductase-like NADH-dependent reductase (Old Yellow Enzyme family)
MTGIYFMTTNITQSINLQGFTLKNRIIKGAMSEALSNEHGHVTPALLQLYETWGKGGLSCAITGNVMIDQRAKNEPNVVVIEDESDLPALQRWAAIGKQHDMIQIVQLSHAGKQAPKGLNSETVAPSAIGYGREMSTVFATPRELTELEIFDLIRRFGESARICKKAGFEGVQIHGAHGYLVSAFLSPLHNQRQDQWGGSLENRMRFLIESYKEIRKRTDKNFIVSVKLNSADFQKGGFSEEDSVEVIKALDKLGIDFIEISGGTYETPSMTGVNKKNSTSVREAYFLEFSEKIRKYVNTPLMVTGGFRTRAGMDNALQSSACDLIGVARPLAVETAVVKRLMAGENVQFATKPIKTGFRTIDQLGIMEIIWYAAQFKAIGSGQKTNPHLSPLKVFMKYVLKSIKDMIQGRKTLTRLRAS